MRAGFAMYGSVAFSSVALAAASPSIEITFQQGQLTVHAQHMTLAQVLHAVGETVGFQTIIYGELDAHRTTWSFVDRPLFQAIRALVRNYGMAMVYNGSTGLDPTQEGAKLWVYGKPSAPPQVSPWHVDSRRWDADSLAQSTSAPWFKSIQGSTNVEDESEIASLARTLRQDEDMSVRRQAAAVLGEIASEEAIRALEGGLSDPHPAVRIEVIRAFEALEAERSTPTLGQVLYSDPSPKVRLVAVQAIARQRSEAAHAFIRVAVKDRDPTVRTTALRALAAWP